jgi:hypothetical protein
MNEENARNDTGREETKSTRRRVNKYLFGRSESSGKLSTSWRTMASSFAASGSRRSGAATMLRSVGLYHPARCHVGLYHPTRCHVVKNTGARTSRLVCFVGAFAKLEKSTASFVMCVRPLIGMEQLDGLWKDFHLFSFHIRVFFEYLWRKLNFY